MFVSLKSSESSAKTAAAGWNLNCTNPSSQKKAALGRVGLRQAAFPELEYQTSGRAVTFKRDVFKENTEPPAFGGRANWV